MGIQWDNGDRHNAPDWLVWALVGIAVGLLILCLIGADL